MKFSTAVFLATQTYLSIKVMHVYLPCRDIFHSTYRVTYNGIDSSESVQQHTHTHVYINNTHLNYANHSLKET